MRFNLYKLVTKKKRQPSTTNTKKKKKHKRQRDDDLKKLNDTNNQEVKNKKEQLKVDQLLKKNVQSAPSSTTPSKVYVEPFKRDWKVNPPPTDRPVRVYADGIYDLFHFGHARSLQQAKLLFPNTYLLVGVCSDALTHKMKGKTVMNEKERYEAVSHCRYVDEVITDAPWIVTPEFIEKHKIDYVVHGEDPCYDEYGNDVYKGVKDLGKFLTIKRTEGISTSDLIMRVVKEYDSYVRRNLKRGYTAKDLNISFVKEQQLKMSENIKKWSQNLDLMANKVKDKTEGLVLDFKKWKDSAEHMIFDFVKTVYHGDWADEEKENE